MVYQRDSWDDWLIAASDNENGWVCPAGEGTFYCDAVPIEEVQRVALIASDSPIQCSSDEPGAICNNVPLFALDQSLAGGGA